MKTKSSKQNGLHWLMLQYMCTFDVTGSINQLVNNRTPLFNIDTMTMHVVDILKTFPVL